MMQMNPLIYMIGNISTGWAGQSGYNCIARALQAQWIGYAEPWRALEQKSWRLGHALRQWGIRQCGSTWNFWKPYLTERRILSDLPFAAAPYIAHFTFAEFGAPVHPAACHKKNAVVVATVHCSARRWRQVWQRPDRYARADHVVIMSDSQRPFVEETVPADRITKILHGVESAYFTPPAVRAPGKRLRLLLLGNTERDHTFAAAIAAGLPADRFDYRIRTTSPDAGIYNGIPCITMLPRLSDADLLEEYQQADLLVMPMLDSAANNVLLESMACGTPVMVNRTGGVPEYVDDSANIVMNPQAPAADWIEHLFWFEQNRDELEALRPGVRRSIEPLDNANLVPQYRAMYRRAIVL